MRLSSDTCPERPSLKHSHPPPPWICYLSTLLPQYPRHHMHSMAIRTVAPLRRQCLVLWTCRVWHSLVDSRCSASLKGETMEPKSEGPPDHWRPKRESRRKAEKRPGPFGPSKVPDAVPSQGLCTHCSLSSRPLLFPFLRPAPPPSGLSSNTLCREAYQTIRGSRPHRPLPASPP